ncbi:unnamed protein product [Discosporangium mesarthrocarpum]
MEEMKESNGGPHSVSAPRSIVRTNGAGGGGRVGSISRHRPQASPAVNVIVKPVTSASIRSPNDVGEAEDKEVGTGTGRHDRKGSQRRAQGSFRPNLHLEMQALSNRNSMSTRMSAIQVSGTLQSLEQTRLDHRSTREREMVQNVGHEGESAAPEALNEQAMKVIQRVQDKLAGLDFGNSQPYDVNKQVDLLIQQATSHENLSQCFIGWCPFW